MTQFYKELDTAQFQARLTLTQADSGNQNVYFNLNSSNGCRLLVTSAFLKMGSGLASGRNAQIEIKDSNDNTVMILANQSLGDNAYVQFGAGSNGANNNSPAQQILIANDDYLSLNVAGMAQNETYQVVIRGFLRGRLPYYDTTGSGGTPTVSSDYYIAV